MVCIDVLKDPKHHHQKEKHWVVLKERRRVCVLYENAAMRHKRGRGNRRGRNFRAARASIKDIDTEARTEDSIQ